MKLANIFIHHFCTCALNIYRVTFKLESFIQLDYFICDLCSVSEIKIKKNPCWPHIHFVKYCDCVWIWLKQTEKINYSSESTKCEVKFFYAICVCVCMSVCQCFYIQKYFGKSNIYSKLNVPAVWWSFLWKICTYKWNRTFYNLHYGYFPSWWCWFRLSCI